MLKFKIRSAEYHFSAQLGQLQARNFKGLYQDSYLRSVLETSFCDLVDFGCRRSKGTRFLA